MGAWIGGIKKLGRYGCLPKFTGKSGGFWLEFNIHSRDDTHYSTDVSIITS